MTVRLGGRGIPAIVVALLLGICGGADRAGAQRLLVPMDLTQTNHLRAYGLTYWLLERGETVEWLLNYRGGSFLMADGETIRREAALRGVLLQPLDGGAEADIRATIQRENMESVPLEKAPRIAVYTPPTSQPWDDAVTLALEYAEIPYERLWDAEVLLGDLSEYDWLHLHHEDFTGQYSKFYLSYAGEAWLQDEVQRNQETARRFGFADTPTLKRAVAQEIQLYVEEGGFLFAMCSATETLDLALASWATDISAVYADGIPPAADANERMDWTKSLAFTGATVELASSISAFSNIDYHQVNTPLRAPLGYFSLFEFAAKIDPVPTMLVQNHETIIPDFYGLTSSFRVSTLKPGVTVLATGGPWAKYVRGSYGEGTWTFYGGHDPEDPEHNIGDPATNLDLFHGSPGYRLILNNVLFPAAKPKPRET